MIPIFEQGPGKGIGHTLDSFLARFDAICQEQVENKRAKAFAFIFYDFEDHDLRQILRDQGVFTQLDRLASTNLSIFFLHAGSRTAVARFNSAFLLKLKVLQKARPPCVVFFRFEKNMIRDVTVAEIDSADLVHGFHELYGLIDRYIEADVNKTPATSKALRMLKSGGEFIGREVFEALLKAALDHIKY